MNKDKRRFSLINEIGFLMVKKPENLCPLCAAGTRVHLCSSLFISGESEFKNTLLGE
jgi:hypothetical protein